MATNVEVDQRPTALTSRDLPQLLSELYRISPNHVVNFGLQLRVDRGRISSFEIQYRNMDDVLREVLNEALNHDPPLTWSSIVRALRDPSVREHGLARQIEAHYCLTSFSSGSDNGAQIGTHAPLPQINFQQFYPPAIPQARPMFPDLPKPLNVQQPAGSIYHSWWPRAFQHLTPQYTQLQPGQLQPNPVYQSQQLPLPSGMSMSQHPSPVNPHLTSLQRMQYMQQFLYNTLILNPTIYNHPPCNQLPRHDSAAHPHMQAFPLSQPQLQSTFPQDQPQYSQSQSFHPSSGQHHLPFHSEHHQSSLVNPLIPSTYSSCISLSSTLPHVATVSSRNIEPSHSPIQRPLSVSATCAAISSLATTRLNQGLPESRPLSLPSQSIVTTDPSQSILTADPSQSILTTDPSQSTLPADPSQSTLPADPSQSILTTDPSQSIPTTGVITIDPPESSHHRTCSTKSLSCGSPSQQSTSDLHVGSATGHRHTPDRIPAATEFTASTSGSDRPPASKRVKQRESQHSPLLIFSADPPESSHIQSQSLLTIEAHPPPDPSKINTFINYVKGKYCVKVVERDQKWSLSPTVEYINLACINRKDVKSRREYEDVTKAMVQDGNVDTIQEKKGPIEFSEIAKDIHLPSKTPASESDPKPVGDRRLILVEGAPGVGKSTFAWEFCRRWEKGEIAQQYDLVLLLRLRDKGTRNATSLEQLIKPCHPLQGVSSAVCLQLVNSQSFHALIILEGYDELPDSQRNNSSSIFNELISGDLLPLSTVLVTSRPWATKEIRKNQERRIYQHIEVLGFTKRQITEYIKKTVPTEQVSDLNSYLERHPQIKSGMYIPLNSAIVVAVYIASKTDHQAMPNTLTELYRSVIIILIKRHLKGHPELQEGSRECLPAIDMSVPFEVCKNFRNLCKLAYSGIVGEHNEVRLIFSEFELPPNFDNLGFMDSVTELYLTEDTVTSHNFLHLTFQEFFAAVHISSMAQEQQLEYFKKDSGRKDGRLKVVLRFLAGLQKLDCITKQTVYHIVESCVASDESQNKIFPDIEVDIDIINWMFESQNDKAMSLILGEIKVGFKSDKDDMLAMDFYSLGYCISHSQCQWLLCLTGRRGLSKEKITMLTKGATSIVGTGKIVGLEYTAKYQCRNLEMLFTTWNNLLHLHQLTLTLGMEYMGDFLPDAPTLRLLELDFFCDMWIRNLPLSLHSLKIDCITLSSTDSLTISSYLNSTTCLKELELKFCFAKNNMKFIAGALVTNHSKLERLRLVCCRGQINKIAYQNLIKFLLHTKSLQQLSIMQCKTGTAAHKVRDLMAINDFKQMRSDLRLYGHHVSRQMRTVKDDNETIYSLPLGTTDLFEKGNWDDGETAIQIELADDTYTLKHQSIDEQATPRAHQIQLSYSLTADLAQVLKHNSTIQELTFSNAGSNENGLVALAEALHHNFTLQVLTLSHIEIGDNEVEALATALQQNSTIRELSLTRAGIDGNQAAVLAQALYGNTTIEVLTLSDNSLGNMGGTALAQALRHNSILQELTLSRNGIRDAGTVDLAQALHSNSTLQRLILSDNDISTNGVAALATALSHNSSLKELDLHSDNIIIMISYRALIHALTENSSITVKPGSSGLCLPLCNKEYAMRYPEYSKVKHKITFR